MFDIHGVSLIRPSTTNTAGYIVAVIYYDDLECFDVAQARINESATAILSYLESAPKGMTRDGIELAASPERLRWRSLGTTISEKAAIKLGYRAIGDTLESPARDGWREEYFGPVSFGVLTGKVAAPNAKDNPVIGSVPEPEKPAIFAGSDDDFAARRKRRRKRRKLGAEVTEAVNDDLMINLYHPATSSEIESHTALLGVSFDGDTKIRNAPEMTRNILKRGNCVVYRANMLESGTTRSVVKLAPESKEGYYHALDNSRFVCWGFMEDSQFYFVGNSSLRLDGKTSPNKPRPINPKIGYPTKPGNAGGLAIHRTYEQPDHIAREQLPPFDGNCEFMLYQPTDTKHGGKWYTVRLIALLRDGQVTGAFEVSISHGKYGSHYFNRKSADVFHDLEAARAAFYNRVNAKLNKGYTAVKSSRSPWFLRDS